MWLVAGALVLIAMVPKEIWIGLGVLVGVALAAYFAIKLLGNQAWFVRSDAGEISAFLLKDQAEAWAKEKGGKVLDYPGARSSVLASN